MNRPFAAYDGTEPYAFVCYAHKNSETVYSDLIQLRSEGVNLWYDEGIPAGSSWRGEIAAAIQGAQKFIFFISEASLNSNHCLREVDYALNHDKEIVPVYLDGSQLSGELELGLNRVHALHRTSDSMYFRHLVGALKEDTVPPPNRAAKTNRNHFIKPLLIISTVGALLLAGWWSLYLPDSAEMSSEKTADAPNAYASYLDGLKLMERWDKNDNLESASDLFREATAADPTFALAFARLSDALRIRYILSNDQALLDEAGEYANEALRLNSDLAPVQIATGRFHATMGNIDLAVVALNRAIAIDPNDAAANEAMATILARLGRLEEAEASFRRAIALDPENLLSLDSYANFLFAQSRFEEAANQWTAVVRLAPDHFAALVNLGSALSESDRIPEAITMYQRAIEIRPTYMGYSNLATAYGRAERYAEAIDALLKALEIDDTDWLAWGNLAYVYSWVNGMDSNTVSTFEHAILLAESARQKNSRDPWVNSDLALYYAKTGQPELAVERLTTATTLSPNTAEIQAAAAEAYEVMGQREKSLELARRAIELGFPSQQLLRNPEMTDLLADPRMQTTL